MGFCNPLQAVGYQIYLCNIGLIVAEVLAPVLGYVLSPRYPSISTLTSNPTWVQDVLHFVPPGLASLDAGTAF